MYGSFGCDQHRNYLESVEEYFNNLPEAFKDVEPEVLAKMIEMDTVIDLQFYPDTPIGSYSILHYDLDLALDEALSCFEARHD